jgi:hypothetical protein
MWIIRRSCGSCSSSGSSGDGGGWAVVYIGTNPPVNPVDGFLWIDVSNGQFVLKSYDGGTWKVVQTELQWDKVDGGSL